MTATTLSKQTAPGFWSTTGLTLTQTAADTSNGNDVAGVNDFLLIANNTGASPYTVTITSQADPVTGRSGDVSAVSIAAGAILVFRLTMRGWADSNGKVNFTASNAAVKFGLVTL